MERLFLFAVILTLLVGCGEDATEVTKGQEKAPAEVEPLSPAIVNPLSPAMVNPLSPGIVPAAPEKKPEPNARPSWVEDPESFFDEPRPDLVLAVGSAEITDPRKVRAARRGAEVDARARLLRVAAGRETGHIDGTVQGAKILAYWQSPEGQFFALISAEKANVKVE